MKDWKQFILLEQEKKYFKDLQQQLAVESQKFTIYPEKQNIFRAFEITPLDSVKCVIIGQDPYFNPGQAYGLAFSVRGGCKIPPSLRNIFKEIESDLGINNINGDLTSWAKQGVLLINRVLTVRKGEPNSHKDLGWMEFTKSAIEVVSDQKSPTVFMLWGGEARKFKKIINKRHLVLEAPHPSPLSSYRGFFGCKHFSKCNIFLEAHGRSSIKWES